MESYICSICNSHFKIFEPYGVLKRLNARCYNCGSLERHRLLYKYLIEETDLFKNSIPIKILHIAPEKVFYDIFLTCAFLEFLV